MEKLFLGIFPPNIATVLLPLVLGAIVGSLLCYLHRLFAFVAIPVFLAWCIYQIKFLEFFTDLFSTYMLIVYSVMVVSVAAMAAATFMNLKKHRASVKLS
jgi:hypothetical protein